MNLPDGVFVVAIECERCGYVLNNSKPITKESWASVVTSAPLNAKPCPNGCHSAFSDMNTNVRFRLSRPDGTFLMMMP